MVFRYHQREDRSKQIKEKETNIKKEQQATMAHIILLSFQQNNNAQKS